MRRVPNAARAIASALLILLMGLSTTTLAHAGGGPLGIDYMLTYDDSGIWNRKYQLALIYGLIGGEVVGAVWEGGDSRWGKPT